MPALSISAFPRRMFVSAVFGVTSLMIGGLFLLVSDVLAYSSSTSNSTGAVAVPTPGTAYLSDSARAVGALPVIPRVPMLEMHVANNGLVLLRGARVVSISGSVIRVDISWGLENFSWTVHVDSGAKFIKSTNGEKITLADAQLGDFITVTGQLVGDGTEPVIEADFIRD